MVGQNIGKYRVADRIGRGGMGTVYRAIDETLHRDVAIKVLNAELNDPEIAKRFRAEAITVARLSHPGIATIYELFQHEGQWLMVMEFVRGETLEHLVERMGPLSPQRAAELSMQALGALAHAHSMGVVHRDLKPANLMVTETGAIKIMDFGIARVSGTEHLTSAGFMMGTPAYMAPEQVLGQEIDARADLYAIGVVFYRLTSGKLPFKGGTPFAMAQSQVNDPPTPVSTFRNDLPPWVEQILVRALAKNPDERFQSSIEFHEAFARCLAGLPLAAPSYSSTAPTELMTTPPRAMPTGSLRGPATSRGGETEMYTGAGMPAHATETIGPFTPQHGTAARPTSGGDAIPSQPPVAPIPVRAAEPPPGPAVRPLRAGLLAIAGVLTVGLGVVIAMMLRGSPAPAGAADAEVPVAAEAAAPEAPPPAPATMADTVSPPEPAAPVPPPPADPVAPAAAGEPVTRPVTPATAPAGRASRGGLPADDVLMAFTDVKALAVDGRRARDEDVLLNFAAGQITVIGRRSGAPIASLPYRSIAGATYQRGRNPRWNPSLASPPENLDVPGGFLRTPKHWLALQLEDSFLILQLDGSNWTRILRTLEERTGVTVDRSRDEDSEGDNQG